MPPAKRNKWRRIGLIFGLVLASLTVLLLLAVGGVVIWLRSADLAPLVAEKASNSLGRQVTIGHLEVRWADPIAIDVTDLRIANAPWGSQPDMIRIGRLAALLDAGDLWRGVLYYDRLRIHDATVVLERDESGTGNWKFAGQQEGGESGGGGLGLVPKDRTQFPTLIDFAGEDGLITYRARSGKILRIELNQVAISSPSEDAPVILSAEGAYNNVATRLDATAASYKVLRDADEPFPMDFTLAAKDTDIAFKGTAMEPLDFDGMDGRLSLDAKTLNDILAAMQSEERIDLPLKLAGHFTRAGDNWALKDAKGQLNKTDVSGDLALIEGKPGTPDDVRLTLDFAPLDLDPLLAALGAKQSKGQNWTQMPLFPAALRALKLSADLKTPQLSYGDTRLKTFAIVGRVEDGKVSLKNLHFAFGGGMLNLAGELSSGKPDMAQLQARLSKADISTVAQMLGATGDEIRGRLDGAATLSLRGETLGAALAKSRGAVLLSLGQGDIARSLIEQVSADLRSIFRTEEGRVPVKCLLAAMRVKDGIGTLAPLRLETDAAVLRGAGVVDLGKRSLDLTLQTERDSTNFFALDLPIRIKGPFGKLAIDPQLGDDADVPNTGAPAIALLPANLREMAVESACVQ
jgi:uncharacterized protein involved in outer membrane biogenesis